MDPVVVYVPSCVQNGSESLGLKALEDFNVVLSTISFVVFKSIYKYFIIVRYVT
jgi:hypothetical protein